MKVFLRILLAAALTALALPGAGAQEEAESDAPAPAEKDVKEERKPPRCVNTTRIRSSQILDNKTIILDMVGRNNDLKMSLRYPCHQLKFHDYFFYRSFAGRLCVNDLIFDRGGSSCPIASFSYYEKPDKKEKEDKDEEEGDGGGSLD